MMIRRRLISKPTLALIILVLTFPLASAQQQVGIPVKIKEGFVLEFSQPFDRILLDAGETNFTTKEATEIFLDSKTVFLNRKDAPFDRNLIRPGMKVEIVGERLGSRVVAASVKVKINVESWDVEVKGYFEKLDGDRAKIDGQTVVLEPGAVILGDNEWRGKTFRSFNEMMLGSHVEVKGARRSDGVVYATAGKTKPNIFSAADRKLKLAVQQGMLLPPANQLAGGQVKIGNQEFKLVESLEMQSYVTLIGYKLVPRYMKDMAADDPGKITFRFYVIEADSFNAFALPDGSVFIHTGLLNSLKNEAQLAAVLGHEIAHVTYEHSRRSQERVAPQLLALGAIVAGSAMNNEYVALAGMFGAGVLSNKFGREYEDEADRVGLFYMYEAGYDPREAPKVWREMAKKSKEDAVSNFLYSDHSSAEARLRNLNREIAYNYYNTDFAQSVTGEEKYASVVGGHFGWIQQPKTSAPVTARQPAATPPPAANSLAAPDSTSAATPQTKSAPPPPVQPASPPPQKSPSTLFGNPPSSRKKAGAKGSAQGKQP